MPRPKLVWTVVLAVTAALACAPPSQAGTLDLAQEPVRVTVTVFGRGQAVPPALHQDDVLVRQNGERRPVTEWTPAETAATAQGQPAASLAPAGLDFVILVDDSLAAPLSLQFRDLARFINALPADAPVAVAYADNGAVRFSQRFTTDHARAAKALRLPLGRAEAGSSIYQAVGDLMKRWPRDGRRHEVLLISNGLDLWRGVVNSEPGLNPDLEDAISSAQREGATVYTLFANAVGRYTRNFFLLSNGQSCLTYLTSRTGGESYFQGFETPVDFRPFLNQLHEALQQQYVVAFEAAPAGKPGLEPVQVSTEQPGVRIKAPDRVYVGGTGK